MDRRSTLLLALLVAFSGGAGAVSKCRDSEGRLVYLQTRSCPVHLEQLPYSPPPLNRIETSARSTSEWATSKRATKSPRRRATRRPDPKDRRCARLKERFRTTNESCRGVSGCRKRNYLRQELRELYKQDFCFTRSGAIDSFQGR